MHRNAASSSQAHLSMEKAQAWTLELEVIVKAQNLNVPILEAV